MAGSHQGDIGSIGTAGRVGRSLPWLLVAITAIGLRVWNLSWGLPTRFPDEILWAGRMAGFVPLKWSSFALGPDDLQYPALYGSMAGLVGALSHAAGFTEAPTWHSASAVLIARGVSAAAGIASVFLVGLLGLRLYSPAVGFVAAALFAVAPLHAMVVHVANTDSLLVFFFVSSMIAAFALAERGTWATATVAGAVAGLGFATKYTGLALLAPVGWAVLEQVLQRRSLRHGIALGVIALAAFAATFIAVFPSSLWQAEGILSAMAMLRVSTFYFALNFDNNFLAPSLGWYGRPYLYQLFASLPYGLGWPLYAIALAGIALAVWRHDRADRVILATLLPYFLITAGSRVTFPRYMLPVLPGLALLAARAVEKLRERTRLATALLAAVWLYSLALSVTQVRRFSLDQQSEVARWIAANVSIADARPIRVNAYALIGVLDYYHVRGPLVGEGLDYARVGIEWFDRTPDAIVVSEWDEIAIRRDKPGSSLARALDHLQSGNAGYHEGARFRSAYLQRDFYTWLDPAFAADLWQGEIGFVVYVRDGDDAVRR